MAEKVTPFFSAFGSLVSSLSLPLSPSSITRVFKCGGRMDGSENTVSIPIDDNHSGLGLQPSSPPHPDDVHNLALEFQALVLEQSQTAVESEEGQEEEKKKKKKKEDDDDEGSDSNPEVKACDDDYEEEEETCQNLEDEADPKDDRSPGFQYPVRPDAVDCSFYLRTGTCKFGSNCKFNHPIKRKNQVAKEKVKEKEKEEFPERPGQTECKYYLRTGGCKFGKACRYNHTKAKPSTAPVLELNFLGLPIRLGEKECPYYMRTGSCKYGVNCRFNHPDPTAAVGYEAPSGFGNGGSVPLQGPPQPSMASWSSPRALNEPAPFVPVPIMFPPTQGVPPPHPEWNGYQAPLYPPPPERSLPPPPPFVINNTAADANAYGHLQQQSLAEEFPERPGQAECSYFLKTGDCKFRAACKYHHPKNRIPKSPPCPLSDKGLPLRPDQNVCTHYNRYGICKFGPACKFDHPVNYGNSASPPSAVPGQDQSPPFGGSVPIDGVRLTPAGSGNSNEILIQQPV